MLSQRPAVVLLHCSGSTAGQWQALIDLLQPRFRPLAVELHGHGARPDWSGERPFTLADDAALVEPLLERLGGAHLVGHSYGGAVALKLASLRGDLVRSVAAYEPVLFRALLDDPESAPEMREVLRVAGWMRARLAEGDAQAAARRFVEYWSGAEAWRYLSPGRQQAIAARMPSVLRHFDALFSEPLAAAQPGRLAMPLLFLAGGRTVASARRLARLFRTTFPAARHEVLTGLGHMGPITDAAAVNPRIEAFLHASDAAERSTLTLTHRERRRT